jgi:O-antigen/teichoic acid export membrane protein
MNYVVSSILKIPYNRRLLSSATLYFFLMGVGSVLMLTRNLVFARFLKVSEFGYLSLVSLVGSYGAVIFNLGLLNGLNRELPVTLGQGDEARAVYLRNLVLSTVIGLVIICALPYFLSAYWWAGRDIKTRYILWAAYAIAALVMLYQFVTLELRGRQLLIPFAQIVLVQATFTIVAGLIGAMFWGLPGAVVALVLGYAMAVGVALRFWIRDLRWEPMQWSALRPLLGIGIPLLLSSLCIMLIQSMDRFFIIYYFGIENLGYYQFAGIILVGGQILAGIVAQWVSPKILYHHGRGVTPATNYRKILMIMGVVLAFFLATAYPFSSACAYLVARFFPLYENAISFIGIFYLTAGFMVINLAGVILNALNRQGLILVSTLATLVVLLTAYMLVGTNQLPILTFAWILLGGQVMITLTHTLLAYRCVRKEMLNGRRPDTWSFYDAII